MSEADAAPRIVVIDDNDLMRETLLHMLAQLDCRAVAADGGDAGIREVARDGADIVITDILMPDKDGLETIRELRRVFPGVRIVAMSGGGRMATTNYLDHARLFGAEAMLAKPFALEDLLAAFGQCGFAIGRKRRSGAS